MTDRSDGPFDDAVEPIAHFVKHLMDMKIERLDQEVRPGYDECRYNGDEIKKCFIGHHRLRVAHIAGERMELLQEGHSKVAA